MDEKAVVKFVNHTAGFEVDVEVPLDITAQDLFIALNRGLKLGVNENDRYNYVLKADKPLACLSGTETLDKFGVRNGTVINFVRGDYNG